METVLIGISISLITYLVEWIKKRFELKISLRLVVCVLCLIAGFVYYWIVKFNPDLRGQIVGFTSGAFAMSQFIRMIADKILNENTDA